MARWPDRLTVGVVCAAAALLLLAAMTAGAAEGKLVPLDIKLPRPEYRETPKDIKPRPTLEPPRAKPRPPFLAPPGCRNLALRKPVAASDDEPIAGELEQITDGNKSGDTESFVELPQGRQRIQIDLGEPSRLYAIVVWHNHGAPVIYHDVAVQVAADADFITGVRTLFNNDYDNSLGLGIGKDKEYIEDNQGRLIDAKGVTARYVRCYTRGNTASVSNHYIEVEVYGKPAP
ncbi:MAG: hypothetical protein ACODAJ_01485 [Planctomycetota bacterium]